MEQRKLDRRQQRTRQLLIRAFMDLLVERGFDKITIQDIAERANLGRTTFYAHFESKEDLFIDSHRNLFRQLNADIFREEGTLNPEPSNALIEFLSQLRENRVMYFGVTEAKSGSELMQRMTAEIAGHLEEQLHQYHDEATSHIPFSVLAYYIAGAMINLIHWWISSRASHTAEDIANMLCQLRNATLTSMLD